MNNIWELFLPLKTMQQDVGVKQEGSFYANLFHIVQSSVKEKLDGIVSTEIDNATEISPQTWKIVAYNVAKSAKDSPQMISLLQSIQSTVYLSFESFLSGIGSEAISDTCKAKLVPHELINDETCDRKCYVLQYEQLGVDMSQHSPLEVRKQAFDIFLQAELSEVMENVYWPQIRHSLRDSLCDRNSDIFSLSLKVHAKLMQSASQVCIREGFSNLVDGLNLYYNTMCHNSLPSFQNGLDGSNPVHCHISQISYLVLEAVKEMPRHWLRYGERRFEEIVAVFVNLLAMHTYNRKFHWPRDIIYPFHVLSVLDPKAKWCTHWLHGAFGQHLFFNTLTQNSTLVTFLIGEILSYFEAFQSDHTGYKSEVYMSGHIVKYATFAHALSILSKVICFEKGREVFSVAIKTTSGLPSLEVILVRMIMYLNLHTNYESMVLTPLSGSAFVMEFIKKVLQNGYGEINGNLMRTIIEPIQHISLQPIKCNDMPWHTIEILLQLASSINGISCLLGSRQKRKISIAKLGRNQNSTNISALGLRKNRMSIPLERQFSAQSVRIPSISDTDMSNPAKVIEHTAAVLLRSKDMSNVDILLSLVEICSKLFRIHEGLSMLDALNSELVSAVTSLYKQLSFKNERNRCSGSRYPFKSKDYVIPSHALYKSLTSFLMELASTPCGLAALAQEDSVLKDLLTTILQSSHVPWEDPYFRHIVSLITTTSQGVSVLAEESCKILTRPLCNLWNEYEDPVALITGSERNKIEATQHFINIIYTFVPNLQGVVALLSEPESSSESTLVDADPAPRTLSELLAFERNVEPWHYISLLTLRALTTNMDVSLYLNNAINFQDKLLKLQSENVTYDSELTKVEESRLKSGSVNKFIIIDQCSLLRHHILIATYTVGGPSEWTLPPAIKDTEYLGDDSESHLFCNLPPPQLESVLKKTRSTQLKGQTDLQRFLQDTKQGLHDANWLSHARRAYKTSCTDDIKVCMIMDLLEQVAKLSSNSESYLSASSQEAENDVLLPEECFGVQITIRYGVKLHLLQENSKNEENLRQLLHLSHSLKYRKDETFQGFDWFIATVFVLCGGNMERSRRCIGNISSLPVAPFLWPALAAAKDHTLSTLSHRSFMFGHILELLVKIELPLAFSALQLAGVSWWLICRQWMAQCFWNILDWSQICHWLVVSILNQPDFLLYFCVSLLRHIEPKILQAASEGQLWEQLMFAPMEGFHVCDQLSFMEKLAKRHRTSVLHHLLGSTNNTI